MSRRFVAASNTLRRSATPENTADSGSNARSGPLGRQKARDRRLAATRRPPKDHRGEPPGPHHAADRSLRAEQMVLAEDVAEALRPQPVRQRPRCLRFK